METNDTKLLMAIQAVELKVERLSTKIDDGVIGRFKDNERRIDKLEATVDEELVSTVRDNKRRTSAIETNIKWLVLLIVGAVMTSILKQVIQ